MALAATLASATLTVFATEKAGGALSVSKPAGPSSAATAATPLQPAAAPQIWWEQGLAHATVGYDTVTRDYVHLKYYLAAYGPTLSTDSDKQLAARCGKTAATQSGVLLAQGLRQLAPLAAESAASTEEYKKLADQRDVAIDGLINAATYTFRETLRTCSEGRFGEQKGFTPALLQRVCNPRGVSCDNAPLVWANHPSSQAFTALSAWIDNREASPAPVPANIPILLPEVVNKKAALQVLQAATQDKALAECRAKAAAQVGSTDQLPPLCLMLELAARQFAEATQWPEPPREKAAQALLEDLVVQARQARQRIASSVPLVLNVPQEVAVRFADSLDDVQRAVPVLRQDNLATFVKLQDEVARSRIMECVKWRAESTAAAASVCAGYKLDDDVLAACVKGKSCAPALANTGSVYALLIGSPTKARDAFEASVMPRLGVEYEKLRQGVNKCAAEHPLDRQAAERCLVDVQIGQETRACLEKVRKGDSAAAIKCATSGKEMPPEARKAAECWASHLDAAARSKCVAAATMPTEASDVAKCFSVSTSNERSKCVAAVTLPGKAQDFMDCKQRAGSDNAALLSCMKTQRAKLPREMLAYAECKDKFPRDDKKLTECMVAKNLKLPEEVGYYKECRDKFGEDQKGVLACVAGKRAHLPDGALACLDKARQDRDNQWSTGLQCMAMGKLPKEVSSTLDCIKKAEGDTDQAIACTTTNLLPPKVQKTARCMATSTSATQFGVCNYGDKLPLNKDQMVLVECAVANVAYAVCVGGRMLVDTLVGCLGNDKDGKRKRFGSDGCMGDSNDLIKAFRALGINLTGNNPVGRMANAHLATIQFGVAAATALLHSPKAFFKVVGGELQRTKRNFERETARFNRESKRVMNQAEANWKGLGRVFK